MEILTHGLIFFRMLFQTDYPLLTKIKILLFLEKLELKLIFNFKRKQNIVHEKFLGYEIASINYKMLQFLVIEIFVNQDYIFKSDNATPLIFDCGANMGIATIYLRWLYPKSRIFAFEPDFKIFQLLKENVESNKLSDVYLFNLALSDKRGVLEFYPYVDKNEWNFGIGSTKFESTNNIKKTMVDCVVLSDYVKDNIVDFIKMDIEGAESDVIKELVNTGNLNNVKQLKIEYHHKIKKPIFGSFLRMFELEGFRYKIRNDYSDVDTQTYLVHCIKKE